MVACFVLIPEAAGALSQSTTDVTSGRLCSSPQYICYASCTGQLLRARVSYHPSLGGIRQTEGSCIFGDYHHQSKKTNWGQTSTRRVADGFGTEKESKCFIHMRLGSSPDSPAKPHMKDRVSIKGNCSPNRLSCSHHLGH